MGVDTSHSPGSPNAVVALRLARRLCVQCRRELATNADDLGVADQSVTGVWCVDEIRRVTGIRLI